MGTMRTPLYVLLSLLFLSHYITTLEVPICNTATYGKPIPSDCKSLFERVTSQQYMTTRLFDDEQLRVEPDESWPGVPQNPFSVPIVQLPKYFSMNTCNFALMTYTNPQTHLSFPLVISDWGSINSSGTHLIEQCLGPQSRGGEISIRAATSQDPVLVLFMWAGGAEFEKKLVKYEYDPTYSPQLLLSTVGVNETNSTSFDSVAAVSTAMENTSVSALPFEKIKPSMSEPVGIS
ncbi:hypothetical protein N7G274_000246 [Stereocaulon virgatum]|uniref:Uncharacterized protein n=1 Tax=Stereocaulon virgatum TaxID=373712 RepID=A0ABR4ARM1_9LECA